MMNELVFSIFMNRKAMETQDPILTSNHLCEDGTRII
jgi:hypothetical protein